MGTHYSKAQDPAYMTEWARTAYTQLKGLWEGKKDRVPVLVYAGMSGIASATVLSLELHKHGVVFGMVYVRKVGEQSHGYGIEYSLPVPHMLYQEEYMRLEPVFVDDFISTGETMRYCISRLREKRGEMGVDSERWVIPKAIVTLTSNYGTAELRKPTRE